MRLCRAQSGRHALSYTSSPGASRRLSNRERRSAEYSHCRRLRGRSLFPISTRCLQWAQELVVMQNFYSRNVFCFSKLLKFR